MHSTSSSTTRLAVILFASQAPAREFAASPARTRELIHQTVNQFGPDATARADAEVGWEYGRHPETAAAHMRACLQAVEATLTPADGSVAR
ncbi:hypothetical protein GCM10009548_94780 [Streptomyces malaysiensis subsp. malaysiensis]|uniref:hypothetical protein n=1 Tax=Streptomyces TaxID=1883 RepID=UPI001E2F6E9D|nr:hypothetical protein [Streptomyces sp. HNM0561]UHH23885.1 hypothetical protein LUV23_47440 [Streptomyces sp. HNM0561]